VSIVATKFWSHLSRSLARAGMAFRQVVSWDEQVRIGTLLTSMNSQYTGLGGGNTTAYGINGKGALMALNVDNMATGSMLLCMRMLHCGLQQDHMLKHQGQLQYSLFLKGAGMSLEEYTLFFQQDFTRIMTLGAIQQAVCVFHTAHPQQGGEEGKLHALQLCEDNNGQPAPGQCRAPYNNTSLGVLLGQLKIGRAVGREVIMSHKRDGHYQLVCMRHFEMVHPSAALLGGMMNLDGVGNHPNTWFTALVLYHNAMSGKA
jgi:DNA primase large subunit